MCSPLGVIRLTTGLEPGEIRLVIDSADFQ